MSTQEPSKTPAEPYEFTPEQNEVISNLGNSMKWVALPAFALAAFCLTNLIMGMIWTVQTGAYRDWQVIGTLIFLLIELLIFFGLAQWTLTASLGFRAIVETRGRDISFLMLALDNLRKMYELLALFVKIFLILAVISLVLTFVQFFQTGKWPQYVIPEASPTTPADK